jgi:hypothetical protein
MESDVMGEDTVDRAVIDGQRAGIREYNRLPAYADIPAWIEGRAFVFADEFVARGLEFVGSSVRMR